MKLNLSNHRATTNWPSISEAAESRAEKFGEQYSTPSSGISSNPEITSNTEPNRSILRWLQKLPKCNHFVGDVLYDAGFAMPTFKMKDGSHHYVNAERLPKYTAHFASVEDTSVAKPGDLMIFDWLHRKGEGGAHVELIDQISSKERTMNLVGARSGGASERQFSYQELRVHSGEVVSFLGKQAEVFILRPIKRRLP